MPRNATFNIPRRGHGTPRPQTNKIQLLSLPKIQYAILQDLCMEIGLSLSYQKNLKWVLGFSVTNGGYLELNTKETGYRKVFR